MKKIDRRLGLIFLTIFLCLLLAVCLHGTQNVDDNIRLWVNAHRTPAWTSFFTTITKLFNTKETLTWCTLVTILAWRLVNRRFAGQVGITSFGGIVLNHFLKSLVQRPRPHVDILMHYGGYSFPSGHSIAVALVCGCLILLVWRMPWRKSLKWLATIGLACLIILIGFSRIYVGAHYPSDVLAGWSLGLAIVFFIDMI